MKGKVEAGESSIKISQLISVIQEESKFEDDDFFEEINSKINEIQDVETLKNIASRLEDKKKYLIDQIKYFCKKEEDFLLKNKITYKNPYKEQGLVGIIDFIITGNDKYKINNIVIDDIEILQEHKIEILTSISKISDDKHLSTILKRLNSKIHKKYISEKSDLFYGKNCLDKTLKDKCKKSLNNFILSGNKDEDDDFLAGTVSGGVKAHINGEQLNRRTTRG